MPPRFNSNQIKHMYLMCTGVEVSTMSALAPEDGPLRSESSRTFCLRPDYQNPQGITKRKKQENIKHSGHITFDETVNIV